MSKYLDLDGLAYFKGKLDTELGGKQDTISDLSTIRSGASAGATAYQKPSGGIPSSDLATAVQTSLGKADTAYQKPSGGIPSSDLASAVQTSLGKADTAVQPDSLPTVPTISTDISADASSDTKTASPKAVATYLGNPVVGVSAPTPNDGTLVLTHRNGDTDTVDLNHTHGQYAQKVEIASSQPSGGMVPGVLYNLGTLTGAVTISFATPSDNTVMNEYMFTFDSGSTAAVPTWPNTITAWVGNCLSYGAPLIAASKHYEVSVIGGYGYIVEF